MSTKPENTFRGGVHKYLPRDLYHVKMSNPYVGGIWDDWYSGSKADLWIEFKFIPKLTPKLCELPDLSALQKDWGRNRLAEGRNLAVIVGCPEGGVLYRNLEWETPITKETFSSRLQTRTELAKWILAQTIGGP